MGEKNWETDGAELREEKEIRAKEIAYFLRQIRTKRYLVHMLPNSVSAAFCADALSALGARPLMALCPGEMEEIVSYADALVVNLGQPGEQKQEAARRALRTAGERGLPVVLDPVGAGASAYRLRNLEELMAIPWKGIVKGNEAELFSLFSGKLTHEGIDSVESHGCLETDPERVRMFCGAGDRVFVSTGRENRIFGAEGERLTLWGSMGHRQAPACGLVGTGCITGALMGAFYGAAGEESGKTAAWAALLTMGFVQEKAADARGYGSFRQQILDELSLFTGEEEAFASYLAGALEWGSQSVRDRRSR